MNLPITISRKWTLKTKGDLLENYMSSGFSDILIYNVYFHRIICTLQAWQELVWLTVFLVYIDKNLNPFPINFSVLYLCDSLTSKFLAYCSPAVHLSFDGLKPGLRETMVKDESANNNSAIMKNGAQVVSSGGKCDGAVSLNGMGFKYYEKRVNFLRVNSTPLI